MVFTKIVHIYTANSAILSAHLMLASYCPEPMLAPIKLPPIAPSGALPNASKPPLGPGVHPWPPKAEAPEGRLGPLGPAVCQLRWQTA